MRSSVVLFEPPTRDTMNTICKLALGTFIAALAACTDSSGTVDEPDAATELPADAGEDAGTSDSGRDSRPVDAGPAKTCPKCSAGYTCIIQGYGGDLAGAKQPDGSCILGANLRLSCDGRGTAADGKPVTWSESPDGFLGIQTSTSNLACTPH